MSNINEELIKRIEKIISIIDEETQIENLYQKMEGIGIKLGISERLLNSIIMSKITYEKEYLITLLRWAAQNPEHSRIDRYIDKIERIKNLRYVASIVFDNRDTLGFNGEVFFKSIANNDMDKLLELDKESMLPNRTKEKALNRP